MSEFINPRDLKKEALLYFGVSGPANGVIDHFEEAANKLFKENPCDIYGYLAEYFEQLSSPLKISKIEAQICLDSRGLPTTSVDVYFFHKNTVKFISTFESPISFQFPPLNTEDIFDEKHWIAVNQSIECINSFVSNILCNLRPFLQVNIDEVIREYFSNRLNETIESKIAELDKSDTYSAQISNNSLKFDDSEKNKEKNKDKQKDKKDAKKEANRKDAIASNFYYEELRTEYPNYMLGINAVSQAICNATSVFGNTELFDHINYAYTQKHKEKFNLTTPIVTILSSGKSSNGKVKCCKEYLLFPSPKRPINQVIWEVNRIYNYCWKNINAKTAMPWCSSELGALNANFDKVEQGIDLLEEAIGAIGLKPGQHYYLGINVFAADFYNPDKEKYEPLQGVSKSGAEMSKFWSDLVKQYPSIIYLVDPLIKKDEDDWWTLCREISNRCFVIGGQVFGWAHELRGNDAGTSFPASGIEMKMNDYDTVTDVYYAGRKFKESCKEVIMVYSVGDGNNSFIIDLALAIGCRFVRIGALTRGEKTLKMNRLLRATHLLISRDGCCVDKRIVFPEVLRPSEPAAEAKVEEGRNDGGGDTAAIE